MLDRIDDLYAVEYLAADLEILGTDAHRALRQRCSAPIVEEIALWLEQERDHVPPKSPLGLAYAYLANQIPSRVLFLHDPQIALDNNISERMLRTIAIGRNYAQRTVMRSEADREANLLRCPASELQGSDI
jgi:transposase